MALVFSLLVDFSSVSSLHLDGMDKDILFERWRCPRCTARGSRRTTKALPQADGGVDAARAMGLMIVDRLEQ